MKTSFSILSILFLCLVLAPQIIAQAETEGTEVIVETSDGHHIRGTVVQVSKEFAEVEMTYGIQKIRIRDINAVRFIPRVRPSSAKLNPDTIEVYKAPNGAFYCLSLQCTYSSPTMRLISLSEAAKTANPCPFCKPPRIDRNSTVRTEDTFTSYAINILRMDGWRLPLTIQSPTYSKSGTNANQLNGNGAVSRSYILGPRGGCYYINGNGNKTYVDRSLCGAPQDPTSSTGYSRGPRGGCYYTSERGKKTYASRDRCN